MLPKALGKVAPAARNLAATIRQVENGSTAPRTTTIMTVPALGMPDDHGDAPAVHSLCNTARKAQAKGKIDEDRFAVAKMALLPK